MAVAPKQNALLVLRNLIPLNTLGNEELRGLLDQITFEKLKKGATVFRKGDTDNQNVYLLSGKVAMYSDNREVDEVQAGSDTARFPLAHQIPRKFTVVTRARSEVVRVDNRLLGELIDKTGKTSQHVESQHAHTEDWRSQLIRQRVFQQLPPASIHAVMTRMEKVEFQAGDPVVQQDERGDYFYLINKGSCSVARSIAGAEAPEELAQIGPGASFGEEALLSDTPRSCSVSMLTDGVLLRLKKADFIRHVKEPLLKDIDFPQATAAVQEGAIWLDVRSPDAFEKWHLPGAINLPVSSLRYQSSSLDQDNAYIVYCADGRQSSTAAFLLLEQGLQVSILIGGLAAIDPKSPALAKPEESAEIITLRPEQKSTDKPQADEIDQAEPMLEQLREASQRAEQRLRQLKELKNALATSSARLVSMESELDANKQESRRLAAEAGKLKNALEEKEAELGGLIKELTAQLEQASNGKAAAEAKFLELEVQYQSLSKQLESAEASQQELKTRLAEAAEKHQQELEEQQATGEQLNTKLSAAGEQIERLESQLADTKAEREHVEQQLSAEQSQRAELQQRLDSGEEQNRELCGKLESAQTDQADANTALAEAAGKIDELESQLAGLQASRGELEQQLQATRDQQEALTAQQGQLEQQLSERQEQQTELQQRLDSGAALNQELRDQLQALQADKAETQAALSDANGQINALESELADLRAAQHESDQQIQAEQEQQEALRGEREQLQQQLSAEQSQRAELQQRLDSGDVLNQELRDQLQALQADKAETDAALSDAGGQIGALEAQLADLEGARRGIEEQIQAEQKQQEQLRAEREQLQQQLSAEQAQQAELQQRLESGDARNQELNGRLEALQADKAETEQALSGALKQVDDLTVQLETKTAEQAELERQLAGQRDALQQQLESASARIDELNGQYEALQSQSAEAESDLTDAERQISDLRLQLEAHDSSDSELEQQLAAIQAERSGLIRQLESLQQEKARVDSALTEAMEKIGVLESRLAASDDEGSDLAAEYQQERQALEQRLEQQQSQREELEQRLESQLAGLEQQLSGLQSDKVETESALFAANSRITELQTQLSEKVDRWRETEQLLDEAKQREDELANQITGVREQKAATESKLAEAEQQYAQLEARLAEHQSSDDDQLARYQEKLASQAAEQTAARAELSDQLSLLQSEKVELAARQRELEQNLATLQSDKDMAEAAFSDATQQIGELEAKLAGLQSQLDTATRELSEQVRTDREQADAASLRQQLDEAVAARLEAEADVRRQADLLESLNTSGGDLKAIEAELKTLSDALEESDRAYDEALSQVRRLESERSLQDQEMERLEEELKSLGAASDPQTAALIEQLRVEKDAAHTEVERLSGEVQEVRSVLAQYVEQIQQSQAGSDEVEALRAELQLVRERADEDLARMRREAEAAGEADTPSGDRQQVTRLQSELDELQMRIKEQQLSGSAEAAENKALKQEAEAARQTLQEKQGQLEQAEAKARDLQEQVDAGKHEREKIEQALNTARVEVEEADFRRQEAEDARQQVQDALYQVQQEAEGRRARDQAEEEFPKVRAVEVEQPSTGSGGRKLLLGMVAGALLAFAVADGVSVMSGKGELASEMVRMGRALLDDWNRESTPGRAVKPRDARRPVGDAVRQKIEKPAAELSGLSRSAAAAKKSAVAGVSQSSESKPVGGRIIRDRLQDGTLGPSMMYMPGAVFTMGTERNPLEREERPAHTVKLDSFAIGRFEVTFDQYQAFAEDSGRTVPEDQGWGRGDRPVINVTWHDAQAYAEWLSLQTGRRYRLPTEAEWEYAAGAGNDAYYWWGYTLGEGHANCFNCGSRWDGESTAPVGSFAANSFGIHDTAGNVMEWVQDCYFSSHADAPADGSARTRAGCLDRVVRGGAFDKPADSMRITKRSHRDERSKVFGLGFRIARDVR